MWQMNRIDTDGYHPAIETFDVFPYAHVGLFIRAGYVVFAYPPRQGYLCLVRDDTLITFRKVG